MVRRFSSSSQVLRNRGLIYWALVVVCAILVGRIIGLATGHRQAVDGSLALGAGAVTSAADGVGSGLSGLVEMFRIGSHLRNERRMEGEIAVLNTQVQELSAAARENDRLRRLLGLPEYSKFSYVGAEVAARSMDLWFDTLVLNRGREEGIAVQNLVMNAQGLVGDVIEVGHGYAKVRLLTSPDFALSVVSNTSSIGGIVRGQGPTRLSFEYVPSDALLKLQEKLFSAGLAPQADGKPRPRGVLVGYVNSIKTTRNLNTLRITVKPAIDVSNIGPVIVIINQ